MSARLTALWILRVVIVVGLGSFWVQAAWDMRHPPVYQGPLGTLSPPAVP